MRIIYGINPVVEALKSHPEGFKDLLISGGGNGVERIKELAREKGVKPRVVGKETLERISKTTHHKGVVGILKGFQYADIEDILRCWGTTGEKALILILDCIQDPQNLGSLIRTAHSAGCHGVIIPRDRSCEVTPTVVKASAGATEHTLIARVANIATTIERLKNEGIWVAGVEADAPQSIYRARLDRDLAIVIGSEGKGIRRLVKEGCDLLVSIPMKGKVSSLNAAMAGAIALFEVVRMRITT
ncbi:MAG: 23S rRNA (guanosine(2251)-2'-O)-methyltransferase RlmB [Deltaproteobacteria bacterium]|nr:23S rRNA (guanosine(2251)-2'-O)-methyltransferase RlmB [Deltaproteobacteria bacterium]